MVQELLVKVRADTTQAMEGLAGLRGAFIALPVIAAGVGLAALGVASVKMAADFQQGVNRLHTGAGDITDSFASLSAGILKVSTTTGVMTGPLTQAMYLILSSGQRGTEAYNTLAVAAKGAQIEQANVADVANVVSGVMTNYGTNIYSATQYMNGLISAVSHGKITLQDLSTAMGPIDPIAQHLGISMADVAAAMTTQTNAMIPADRAATGLRFMMSALENPTAKANTAMKELGLNSVAVANEMKVSLPGALEMIVQAALKVGPEGSVPFNRAVGDMVGGIRGLTAFMGLTGPHMADFIKNSAQITAAMKAGGSEVNGWALAQSGFNIKMDQAKAAVAALMIELGQKLLPVATQLVDAFTTKLLPALTATIGYLSTHQDALIAVAGVIGGLLAGALAVAAVAAWALVAPILIMAAPFIAVGLAVGLVVAGIVLIIKHWGDITAWLGNVWGTIFNAMQATVQRFVSFFGGIVGWIGNVFSTIGAGAGNFFSLLGTLFTAGWNALVGIVRGAITTVIGWFDTAYNHSYVFKAIVDLIVGDFLFVKSTIITIWTDVTGFLVGAWNAIKAVATTVWRFIVDVITIDVNLARDIIMVVWNTVSGFLAGIWNTIAGAARVAWSLFVSVIQGQVSAASGAVGNIITAIKAPLLGALTLLWQAGKDIVQGLLNGIGSMFSAIGTKVHDLGDLIKNSFIAVLGIHSPSTVFAEYGSSVGQGFIDGITSKQQGAAAAAKGLANAASNAITAVGTSQFWNAGVFDGNAYNAALAQSTADAANRSAAQHAGMTATARAASGGIIPEMVVGVGLSTGTRYSFGEEGPELVTPLNRGGSSGFGSGGSGGSRQPVHIHLSINGKDFAEAILPDLMQPMIKKIQLHTGLRI